MKHSTANLALGLRAALLCAACASEPPSMPAGASAGRSA